MVYADHVKLAHLSVKEYMLSSCRTPQFRITETASHSLISKTCLAYLAQFDQQIQPIGDRPLALYAAKHWIHHGKCGDVESEAKHRQLALNVFQRKIVFRNWNELQNGIAPRFEPICHASAAGLGDLVRGLLEGGADVNAKDSVSHGTALRVASSEGHEAIVNILLDHGADVNTEDYFTALEAASSRGHEAIVNILLAHGADVNYSLLRASSNGHEAIVKILLAHGADVNDGDPLQGASSIGHEAIVRILLEHGADVDAGYFTPLQMASLGGHEAVVNILLDHGADVNAGDYRTALELASSQGHEAIVKILLDAWRRCQCSSR